MYYLIEFSREDKARLSSTKLLERARKRDWSRFLLWLGSGEEAWYMCSRMGHGLSPTHTLSVCSDLWHKEGKVRLKSCQKLNSKKWSTSCGYYTFLVWRIAKHKEKILWVATLTNSTTSFNSFSAHTQTTMLSINNEICLFSPNN